MLKKTMHLQQLEILENRNGLDSTLARDLWSERKGFTGESCGYDLLRIHGQGHWEILHDTWIQTNGKSQIDLIVATLSHIYVFEMKYYSGQYTYSKSQQYIDQKPIKGNLFIAYQAACTRMSDLLGIVGYSGRLYSKVVFINPDYPVVVDEEWNHSVLMRHQFVPFIQQMAHDEQTSPRANLSPLDFIQLVKKEFTGSHPYPPKTYSHEEILKIKGGFQCQECKCFDIEVSRYKVCCLKRCSYREDKSIAVIRVICEYAVLRPSEPIRTRDIFEFLGGAVNKIYISRLLGRHFELVPNSYFSYGNPGSNYEYYKDKMMINRRG